MAANSDSSSGSSLAAAGSIGRLGADSSSGAAASGAAVSVSGSDVDTGLDSAHSAGSAARSAGCESGAVRIMPAKPSPADTSSAAAVLRGEGAGAGAGPAEGVGGVTKGTMRQAQRTPRANYFIAAVRRSGSPEVENSPQHGRSSVVWALAQLHRMPCDFRTSGPMLPEITPEDGCPRPSTHPAARHSDPAAAWPNARP